MLCVAGGASKRTYSTIRKAYPPRPHLYLLLIIVYPPTGRYIECKNYAGSVPLKDVAKFKEVLALNNIPLKRGLFITTSTFVPRATTIGVTTIDGEALARWEKRAFAIRALRAARVLTLVTATALVLVDGWDRRYGTSYLPEPLRQPLVTLEQAATKAIKAIKEQLPG